MKAILIPVKNFADSKQRLALHYSADQRAELAAALCEDFFGMGAQSFALHLEEAERSNAPIKVLRNPSIELDIDELDDLRMAARRIRDNSATAGWIARHLS